MLQTILELVDEGELEIHNKIKASDIERGDFIAGF